MSLGYGTAADSVGDWPSLTVSPLAGRVGLQLSGGADMSNVDALQRAISALPPDAGEIHFELASLEFIDLRCVRELVMLTERPARPRLILHHPPGILSRLLGLLWPETGAQFVMAEPARE